MAAQNRTDIATKQQIVPTVPASEDVFPVSEDVFPVSEDVFPVSEDMDQSKQPGVARFQPQPAVLSQRNRD